MHGVVPSQPSENCQHHANSTSLRPGSRCLDQPLHYTQRSSAGTRLRCRAASLPSAVQQAALPSHSQPDRLQSQLLAELNKRSGWHIPDKALFLFCKTMSHFLSDTNPQCCSSSSPKWQFNPRHVGVNLGNYIQSCLQLCEVCRCYRCPVSARLVGLETSSSHEMVAQSWNINQPLL